MTVMIIFGAAARAARSYGCDYDSDAQRRDCDFLL